MSGYVRYRSNLLKTAKQLLFDGRLPTSGYVRDGFDRQMVDLVRFDHRLLPVAQVVQNGVVHVYKTVLHHCFAVRTLHQRYDCGAIIFHP